MYRAREFSVSAASWSFSGYCFTTSPVFYPAADEADSTCMSRRIVISGLKANANEVTANGIRHSALQYPWFLALPTAYTQYSS
jgi:hypothetical protein